MIKKVFDKRVLVEEIITKKETKIILKEDSKDVEYEITQKVIGIAPNVEGINIGDIPCISTFVKPHYTEQIEKSENKAVYHNIYYLHDIAGIKNEESNK